MAGFQQTLVKNFNFWTVPGPVPEAVGRIQIKNKWSMLYQYRHRTDEITTVYLNLPVLQPALLKKMPDAAMVQFKGVYFNKTQAECLQSHLSRSKTEIKKYKRTQLSTQSTANHLKCSFFHFGWCKITLPGDWRGSFEAFATQIALLYAQSLQNGSKLPIVTTATHLSDVAHMPGIDDCEKYAQKNRTNNNFVQFQRLVPE